MEILIRRLGNVPLHVELTIAIHPVSPENVELGLNSLGLHTLTVRN